ncbi:unnamed protein product [Urochloa decumbens]|uniref:Uncharacterized protein n=1 Tax=Urochloa decumbens TaxID=240449 RepID=A0ABC9EFN9_9POAL
MAASQSHVQPASQSHVQPVQSQVRAMVAVPFSQQSVTSVRKRKGPSMSAAGPSKSKKKCYGSGILYSKRTTTTSQTPAMSTQRIVRTTAQGRVATIPGGTACLQIEANVPSSKGTAKVSINVTSGTASARLKAQEPSTSSVKQSKMM